MAKKLKPDQQNGSSSTNGDGTAPAVSATPSTPKKSAKTAKVSAAKGAAKKTSSKAAAKKTSRKPGRKSGAYKPTDSEIRLRAYFIAERRAQLSLEGDPANDWLEALQQLVDEARQRATSSAASA